MVDVTLPIQEAGPRPARTVARGGVRATRPTVRGSGAEARPGSGLRGAPARLVLVAAVVTALTCAGCSSEPATERPAVAQGRVRSAEALPLDAFLLSDAQREVLRRATYAVHARCMSRFGFAVPHLSPPRAVAPAASERYGIVDQANAARNGYHPVPRRTPARSGATLSPAAEKVSSGTGPRTVGGRKVPDGGCLGEARRVVSRAAPTIRDPMLAEKLSLDSFRRTLGDERVLAVQREWRACMAEAGYRYRDPLAANDDPAFRTPAPSPREIAVAVTDVRCKDEIGLVTAVTAVEAEYQQQIIVANARDLRALRELHRVILGNARAVTSS